MAVLPQWLLLPPFSLPPAMKADRKRLKAEKTDLVSQMQQLYATLESREEQLRDFIRNYEQHRKVRPGAGVRPLGFLSSYWGKNAAKWGSAPCEQLPCCSPAPAAGEW